MEAHSRLQKNSYAFPSFTNTSANGTSKASYTHDEEDDFEEGSYDDDYDQFFDGFDEDFESWYDNMDRRKEYFKRKKDHLKMGIDSRDRGVTGTGVCSTCEVNSSISKSQAIRDGVDWNSYSNHPLKRQVN